MPGPSNPKRTKKKAGAQNKKTKKRSDQHACKPATLTGRLSPVHQSTRGVEFDEEDEGERRGRTRVKANWRKGQEESCSSPSSPLITPPPPLLWGSEYVDVRYEEKPIPEIDPDRIEEVLVKPPFIHDPGNGPRVRDTKAFLDSRFFAQPPALNIPMCAEFAQEEVLQMLMTVLPHETARIIWYNKSRATSRICPACQRLYRLGDILPDHMSEGDQPSARQQSPPQQLFREQEISGLCSPVCFVLASFSFPEAIKSTWGRMANEIDDKAWDLLNRPMDGRVQSATGQSLSLVVKMTRLDDLGLAQLCFNSEDNPYPMDELDSDSADVKGW